MRWQKYRLDLRQIPFYLDIPWERVRQQDQHDRLRILSDITNLRDQIRLPFRCLRRVPRRLNMHMFCRGVEYEFGGSLPMKLYTTPILTSGSA